MVTHSDYTRDARVTRYAEALAERGDRVHVLALQSAPGLPREETIGKVNLVRLRPRFAKDGSSSISYLLPVMRFLTASSAWLAAHYGRERFDLLHIHNIPDFLVFAGLYPKIRGAKIILDIHDIVPEFYASKFSRGERSLGIHALKVMETLSAKVANHVIIANDLWLEKYRSRTGANGKCSVFINNVDTSIFRPRQRTRKDDKLIMIFPGGLQHHQGLDIAIRAFAKVRPQFHKLEFHIYGDGNMKDQLIALASELKQSDAVKFFKPLPVREVAEKMANADLGVVPKRADSFGNEAYSTKIMEFMALGIPVVVSKTRIDQFYFNNSVVRFFESGDPDSMAQAICELLTDREARQGLSQRGVAYAEANSWESRKTDYLNLVDNLCGN
jgi:glycosyltransferase involved in cell wall biosynthesis